MGIKGKNDRMVVLACEDCKERNYTTVKNKKNIKERLELSKYCPKCKKHILISLSSCLLSAEHLICVLSSVGRTSVSKTGCRGFESFRARFYNNKRK